MSEDTVAGRAPQPWIDALGRARADVAVERTVPAEKVLDGLRDSLARMRARSEADDDAPEKAAAFR